jgi:hypothetical protein
MISEARPTVKYARTAFALVRAMLVEFITVQRAGTSTFLNLLALSLVDVIGGFTISVRAAQRDVMLESHH